MRAGCWFVSVFVRMKSEMIVDFVLLDLTAGIQAESSDVNMF